ncbi:MAG: TlpA disulfide reductase family protein [Ferruginibacter sp.]
MKQFLLFIGFMIFSSIIFAQESKKPFNPDEYLRKVDSINQSLIGKPYPAFEYKGDDGKLYSNKNLLGKKYYINFWFEGCHPCMEEMDSLIALNNRIKNTNNTFISFTFENLENIKRIRKERGLNFIIIPTTEEECHRLNFGNGFPKHIVVDEKGNIEYFSSYYKPNEESLKEIETLLTKNTTE